MLLLLIGHADKKIFRVPNFAFFSFAYGGGMKRAISRNMRTLNW